MNKPRVALVDDEVDVLETFKSILEPKYIVETFLSASDYLNYIQSDNKNAFDLLIVDYNLGATKGLKLIQQTIELKKHCPFILLSGYLDKETTLQAHNLGAFKILEKPTPIPMLENHIKDFFFELEINRIREENKALTLKLRELCSIFDVFLEQYASKMEIDEFFMRVSLSSNTEKSVSFRDYVRSLESHLQRNMKKEDILSKHIEKAC